MEEKQFISHLPRASVLTLKDQISYQDRKQDAGAKQKRQPNPLCL